MQTAGLKGFPLSLQQARLWKWQQENQAYRMHCALKIEGALEPAVFQQALQQTMDRHEILHTTFSLLPGMEVPVQIVGDPSPIPFPLFSLENLDAAAQQEAISTHLQDLQKSPLNLSDGPLLQTAWLRFSPTSHVVIFSLHALSADLTTLKHLVSAVLRAYASLLSGEELSEEDDELQYIDVATWRNELLQEEDAEEQQAFWKKIDLSALETQYLPFERAEERSRRFQRAGERLRNFSPRSFSVPMDASLQMHLEQLSQQLACSHEAIVLSAWQALLWRLTRELSDETSVLVGLACDGRPYEELSSLLGPATGSVPFTLKTPFNDSLSFEWVVRQSEQALQETIEKQLYFTWDAVAPELAFEQRFFPVSMQYVSCPERLVADPLTASLVLLQGTSEPFVLRLLALHHGAQLQLSIDYDSSLFSSEHAERLASLLGSFLAQTVQQPSALIGVLPLLAQEQQDEQRRAFIAPRRDWSAGWLHELFMQQARRHPQQLAVVCGEEQLRYEQLDVRSTQLAHRLRRLGVGPNQLVVLALPRSADWLVAMLGVLKAGGAYVPLDLEHPPARLLAVIQECQPVALLVSASTWQEWQREQVQDIPGSVLLWETLLGELEQEARTPLESEVRGDDLAAVIYTSGSTGQPKGVMIRHEGMRNYTRSILDLLQSEAGWHFATVSTLAADLGNTALFGALASGGCVHLLPYDLVTNGAAFVRYQQQWPLDVLKIVPSHLQALLSALDEEGGALLPRRALVLGGEALPWSLVERIQELGARCQVYNHYGPTETTVGVLVAPLGRPGTWALPDEQQRGGSVPIGRALPNVGAFILDRGRQVLPPDVVGELYLGGAGLAAGYLHREEQSAERFVPAPWEPEQRLYRTGDLVRGRADGQIEFVGRADGQVKLRGYRVELGEIEEVLRRHEEVREAAVVLRQDAGDAIRLVAYVVPWKVPGPGAEQLRQWVGQQLPDYMVPSAIVKLDQLPLTRNGKLDRTQLPAAEAGEQEERAVGEGPRTLVEELLVGVWEQVLGIRSIGRAENFFRLGGHSLLGTQLIARLRPLFGVEVPITWLFAAPTVAQLAERIEQALRSQQGSGADQAPEIPLRPREDATTPVPLSYAQQRLWFLEQLEPGTSTYNLPAALRLRGPLDLEGVERSLHEVMRRHSILRTHFAVHEGQPVQVIVPEPVSDWRVIDLRAWPAAEREAEARRLVQQEAQRPFDLAQGPLLRSLVLRLDEQDHVVMFTLHHSISDGWSNGVLVRELTTLYAARRRGEPSSLLDLPIQYADYALWQRAWLQGAVQEAQLAYWQRQLAGVPALELPSDHPRPAVQRYRGAQRVLQLDAGLSQQLGELAQQEGVTLFMLLLAGLQTVLMRWSGQTDIAVGTPIANRRRQEVEGLIGLFINTLVLRSDLSGDLSFRALLAQVRQRALEAYQHQDIPFEQVVEALHPERDRSRSPLFQVLFLLQNMPRSREVVSDLTLESFPLQQTTSKFDLTLAIDEAEQGLRCIVEYNTDLFEPETIERFLGYWCTLLAGVLADPSRSIHALPIVPDEERQRLLIEWNATRAEAPQATLSALFEAQVERTPDAIAIAFQDEQVSYGELDRRANQLAWRLRRQSGVGPEILVGLCMERSIELLIGLLGILKAGGAYVPLDPAYPPERLAFILRDAQMPVLLTLQRNQDRLAWMQADTTLLRLDADWPDIAQEPAIRLAGGAMIDTAAYVIYTSGSTGTPKGVVVTHRGLGSLALAQMEHFALNAESHVLQFASISFDASVSEIMQALLVGGTLCMETQEHLLPGPDLWRVLREKAVTTMAMPPSSLAAVPREPLPDLQTVIVSGEPCPADLARYWSTEQRFVNVYGPTETTIWSTGIVYEHGQIGERGPGIGHPVANTQIYLLDPRLQPVPIGAPGEIHIAGLGLARGYQHRPDLTAERFLPDPFARQPGSRMYKTGDLARYRADGTIEFLGRVDEQVKLRGYRIELGEVEAALNRHPAISECAVVILAGPQGDKHLVAYVAGNELQELNSAELRAHLQQTLPHYMIPSLFVKLTALPRQPNQKIDRKTLPLPSWQGEEPAEEQLPAHSPVQDVVLGIYEQVLDRQDIGVDDSFFELGGHSLLATQLIARIRSILAVELPLRSLFEAPTAAGLTVMIEREMQRSQGVQSPPLVPAAREQDLPLSFAQQRLWFLHQLEPASPAYNIAGALHLQGQLHLDAFQRSLNELVRRHESLRTIFVQKDGNVFQAIEPAAPFPYLSLDLQGMPPDLREEKLQQLVRAEARKPFDLARGPLLRITLVALAPEEHALLLTMHHIISDGWSMAVLIRELTALYIAFSSDQPSPLPPLPIQYADYALWQRNWLQGEVLREQIRYWTRQMSGAQALVLPADQPRPSVVSQRGARYSFQLPPELARALQQLSREEDVTLFMTLLSAFQVLLYRWSGQQDIVLGTDSANRSHVETESLIGFFVNLLVLRTQIHGKASFKELVQRVREMVLGAYLHQELPFEVIVEHLRLERHGSHTPLVNALFVMQNTPAIRSELPGLQVQPIESDVTFAKFDLALFVSEHADGISGSVNYRADLFAASTIERLLRRYEALLRAIIVQRDIPIDGLPIQVDEEKALRVQEEKALLKHLRVSKGNRISLSENDMANHGRERVSDTHDSHLLDG